MKLEEARPPNLLNPRRKGPAIIAHRGGNSRHQIRDALAHLADYLEVDLWVDRGQFEARHEASLRPLPFLWGGIWRPWYLKRMHERPFGLAELIRDARDEIGIFLDLKNGGKTAGRLIRSAIDEAHYTPRMAASSQRWSVLRGIAETAPEVDLYYSIDAIPKLDLFLSVSERDLRPRGVSCKHKFITEPLVRQLHDRGLLVIAWTVDDGDRAMQLAEWGVDGITTNVVPRIRDRFSALQV